MTKEQQLSTILKNMHESGFYFFIKAISKTNNLDIDSVIKLANQYKRKV